MNEDWIQRRIYVLTFVESLKILLSQYKETCEVLLDYPKIAGEDIKYFVKESIRNILHANIYIHGRRLIAEFPGDGLKYIAKLQSHCANMIFTEEIRYDRIYSKAHTKEGIQQ